MSTVVDQPAQALALANEIRIARCALKRIVAGLAQREGRVELARILECPPLCVGSARAAELLLWVRGFGLTRVLPILDSASVTEQRRVRDLTARQVGVLVSALRGER